MIFSNHTRNDKRILLTFSRGRRWDERQPTNNNHLTHVQHCSFQYSYTHSVLNKNSVWLALLLLFFILGNGNSERFKGLLSIIQLAMAPLVLKPSSVSVSYVFFMTHIIFYNIQRCMLLKKKSQSMPSFKIRMFPY